MVRYLIFGSFVSVDSACAIAVDCGFSFSSASWWSVRRESLGCLGRKNGLGIDLLSVTIGDRKGLVSLLYCNFCAATVGRLGWGGNDI